nr:DUF3349 domain-containing protein [Rhodococcus sp. HNM0569]
MRAGYPDGVPTKDHFALLAVLRRRLTAAELDDVVALAIDTAGDHPERVVDYDNLVRVIADVTHEEPTDEDIDRVTAVLARAGWPVEDAETDSGTETDSADAAGDRDG